MKKKVLFSAQVILSLLFIFSLTTLIFQLAGWHNPLGKFNYVEEPFSRAEAYNPSLSRLNSVKKLEQYCDSIYAQAIFSDKPVPFEQTYIDVVSDAVKDRFYHGYSYYGFNDNYVAAVVARVTMPGLAAPVIPDEILKYANASCSQQSIVMMEVLRDKSFSTRKISFKSEKFGGHFAFEVFYKGAWHFNDPDMEPDTAVLNNLGRPGIDFLAKNPAILIKAYAKYPPDVTMDLFPKFVYGPVNKFPAKKAYLFQQITQFLTYSIWLFFLIALIFVRRRYLRVKDAATGSTTTPIRWIAPATTPLYYPDYEVRRTQ